MYPPKKLFFSDDGTIPNSSLPLLYYQNVLEDTGDKAASWLEEKFASNGWTNSWRWGVYDEWEDACLTAVREDRRRETGVLRRRVSNYELKITNSMVKP